MKRLQPQQDQPNIHIFRVIKIGGIILILFLVFEVWVVNRLSTMGNKIAQLSQVKRSVELENQLLESEIAKKSALSEIEQKAISLGFKPLTKVESITQPKLAAK